MKLDGLKIGFALTGSYCTLSTVLPQVERLVDLGAEVTPIVSEAVSGYDTRFGKAAHWIEELERITGKTCITTRVQAEPIGPKKLLDILLIAPCTGNTLGKLACGITDTCVTLAAKAHLRNARPVVLAVSSNDALAANARNIGTLLNTRHYYFVPFAQDDPRGKVTSLVANMTLIPQTLESALQGQQLQPLCLELGRE